LSQVDWEELGKPYLRRARVWVVVHAAMTLLVLAIFIGALVMTAQTDSSNQYLRYGGGIIAIIAVLAELPVLKLNHVLDPPGFGDLKRGKAKQVYGKFLPWQRGVTRTFTILGVTMSFLAPEIHEWMAYVLSQSHIR